MWPHPHRLLSVLVLWPHSHRSLSVLVMWPHPHWLLPVIVMWPHPHRLLSVLVLWPHSHRSLSVLVMWPHPHWLLPVIVMWPHPHRTLCYSNVATPPLSTSCYGNITTPPHWPLLPLTSQWDSTPHTLRRTQHISVHIMVQVGAFSCVCPAQVRPTHVLRLKVATTNGHKSSHFLFTYLFYFIIFMILLGMTQLTRKSLIALRPILRGSPGLTA